MKKLKKIITLILIATMLLATASFTVKAENTPELDYIYMMMRLLDMEYYEPIDHDELFNKMVDTVLKDNPELLDTFLDALFGSLDEYTDFFLPEEWREFNNAIETQFVGIGVTMHMSQDKPVIINTLKNSPAQSAGIEGNDVIVAVDGVDISDESLEQISQRLRGEIGTVVVVTVLRDGQRLDFSITRDVIREESVSGRVTNDGIGYMVIEKFNSTTGQETEDVLKDFDSKGVKSIILDLRGNPGGILDEAVKVANYFVPEGKVIEASFKNEKYNQVYMSDLKEKKYNLAVLVDSNTASAAEVLASSIKESGGGTVIGTNTYGKTSIQVTTKLYQNHGAKITIGKYLTRNGTNMDKVGLEPDEYVENYVTVFDDSEFEAMDHAVKYHVGESSKTILGAKQRLNALGYYFGTMDEYFNVELEDAVKQFQTDCGLYSYGVIDLTTQVYIYNKPFENKIYVDEQFNRAYELLGGNMDNIVMK